jgi:hypothetical protein
MFPVAFAEEGGAAAKVSLIICRAQLCKMLTFSSLLLLLLPQEATS